MKTNGPGPGPGLITLMKRTSSFSYILMGLLSVKSRVMRAHLLFKIPWAYKAKLCSFSLLG